MMFGNAAVRVGAMDLVIVRRGETERFRFLQDTYRSRMSAHVIWDRRSGDRRQREEPVTEDRRRGDRRGRPPATWRTMGFVFVEAPRDS